MATLVIGLIVFLLVHIATARLFAPRMPERMITHRSVVGAQSYLPKRWGLWIGPVGSALIGVLGLASQASGHAAQSPSSILLIQGILYVVVLYMYVLNLRRKRGGN